MSKLSHKEIIDVHHPEHINRLLSAFRAGKNGKSLQCRNEKYGKKVTWAIYLAHEAGRSLKNGNKKDALMCWRNSRFIQGKEIPLFEKHIFEKSNISEKIKNELEQYEDYYEQRF